MLGRSNDEKMFDLGQPPSKQNSMTYDWMRKLSFYIFGMSLFLGSSLMEKRHFIFTESTINDNVGHTCLRFFFHFFFFALQFFLHRNKKTSKIVFTGYRIFLGSPPKKIWNMTHNRDIEGIVHDPLESSTKWFKNLTATSRSFRETFVIIVPTFPSKPIK